MKENFLRKGSFRNRNDMYFYMLNKEQNETFAVKVLILNFRALGKRHTTCDTV